MLSSLALSGCGEGATSTSTVPEPTTTDTSTEPEHVHKYEFDSFVWDTSHAENWTAQAKLVCAYDPTHISMVDNVAENTQYSSPTCVPGSRTYVAKYEEHEETKVEVIPPVESHDLNDYGFCNRCRQFCGEVLNIKDKQSVTLTLNGVVKNKKYFYMVKNLNSKETYRSKYLGDGTEDIPVSEITSKAYVLVDEDVKQASSFEDYPEAKVNASGGDLKYSQVNHDALYFCFIAPNHETEKTIQLEIDVCHYLDPNNELSKYGFCRAGEYCGGTHEFGDRVQDVTVDASEAPVFHCWDFKENNGLVGIYTGFSQEATTIDFYILKDNKKMEKLVTAEANSYFHSKAFNDSVDGRIYSVFKTTAEEYMDVTVVYLDKVDEHFVSLKEKRYFGGTRSYGEDLDLSIDRKLGNTWFSPSVNWMDVEPDTTYEIKTDNKDILNNIKAYQIVGEDLALKELPITDNKIVTESGDSFHFEIISEADLDGVKFSVVKKD